MAMISHLFIKRCERRAVLDTQKRSYLVTGRVYVCGSALKDIICGTLYRDPYDIVSAALQQHAPHRKERLDGRQAR